LPPLLRVQLGDPCGSPQECACGYPSTCITTADVSPQGNSDNVFVHVHPGGQFEYAVHIPAVGRRAQGSLVSPAPACVVENRSWANVRRPRGRRIGSGIPVLKGLPERFFSFKHAELGETEII